ncbi:hypothetical protein HXX76_010464 [Chlamydomonas incerta]|uniref:Structural maintenance of chromosomes protein n=1 Tax=Chlamydomonas incerta TaxID=51695 RepID=A0A835SYN2_CHLIN|nr:hypothetical protein HXX76_010464 [Chlamydomonas incerta]|eukprot:KAG2428316.1 hypothetical protein HXX76_010464 [Chlamydomonas incerta]
MGRIDRLEVENFKSYRGRQFIGPFKPFTAVIGPNGSGKSNLMDAISFVLGVKTTQLRGSLKELLYSDGTPGGTQARRGYVKLVYVVEERAPDARPGDPPRERELVFARHILPASGGAAAADPDGGAAATYKSEFRVDDRAVSWEAYGQRLAGLGILVKVRNFLVFQGDIEAVASKSPAGLTQLFEQISGSEALKEAFEAAAADKAAAEEKVSLLFTRRKQLLAEVKAKKREKEEAERHAAAAEELRLLKSDLAVWQLAAEGRALGEAVDDQRRAEEALAALQHKTSDSDGKLEALRRKAAGFKKDMASLEKRLKKMQAERDKKSPGLLKAKEELGRVSRFLKTGAKTAADKDKAVGEQDKKLRRLERELDKFKQEEAALAAEVEAHYAAHDRQAAGGGLASAAMQAEYAELKARVGAQTAKQDGERRTLQSEQEAEREQLAHLREGLRQLGSRAEQLRAQAAEAEAKQAGVAGKLEELRRELAEKQAARVRAAEERTRTNAQRQAATAKLAAAEGALEGIRLDRSQSRRERDMAEMAEELRRRFPGAVYGKLVTLAKPANPRYQLALQVAMQRDLDAVVVDSAETAKACIQILRDEKKPRMDFLPLNFIRARPVNEALRQSLAAGGGGGGRGGGRQRDAAPTARLAIDLLHIADPRHERAFAYALGDTVICDGEEEARRLAFGGGGGGGPARLKVVTLLGTLITKRGTMTGGSAPPDARAARWDEGEVTRLRREVEQLAAALAALPPARTQLEAEAGLSSEVGALTNRIKYTEADAKESGSKISSLQQSAQRAEDEAGRKRPAAEALAESIEAREGRIQALTDAINAVADRVMSDFSARAGVANIREWEERHAAFEAGVSKRRRELQLRTTSTQTQLDYERSHLDKLRSAAAAAAAEVAEGAARQKELEATVAAAQEAAAAAEGEVAESAKRMDSLREQVAAVEAEAADIRAAAAELGRRAGELRRAAAGAAAAAEERAGRMLDLINAARLDQVKLPAKRADGEEEEDEEEAAEAEEGASDSDSDAEGEEEEEEQEDEEEDEEGDAEMRDAGRGRKRKAGGGAAAGRGGTGKAKGRKGGAARAKKRARTEGGGGGAGTDGGADGGGQGRYIDLDEVVAGLPGGGAAAGGGDGEGEALVAAATAALAATMLRLAGLLDTRRLSKAQLAATSARERERVRAELEGRVAAAAAALAARAAPNMRAGEQYGAIKERERAQLAELHAAQSAAGAAAEAFARLRGQRHDLFSAAFRHIAQQISAIYKDLTRSSTHPLGGQAYLHLENEEEPYAGGIKFTAIPPAKRFRDMEQLSGGEKTVAALALLFALHSFRPSPFFVLDEVDAALDAANVARVAHYIRRRTRQAAGAAPGAAGGAAGAAGGGGEEGEEEGEEGGGGGAGARGFQSIVISLKDIFYEKADALVGVCRDLGGDGDPQQQQQQAAGGSKAGGSKAGGGAAATAHHLQAGGTSCSKTFTFDLSRFEEPEPDV